MGQVLTDMVTSNTFSGSIYWIGYIVLAFLMIGVFFIIYYFTGFDHKVMVFPIYGSGKDGVFSVQKPKYNRVKWVKQKTAWRSMKPFFNNKDLEPFDAEYIYPGKRIYAFELNNEWVPGRVNINKSETTMRAEINPVPYFIRNWQGLQYKQNAIDYANPGWWDENKAFVMTIVTVGICCATVLAAIYFTYQYLAPGRADIQAFTTALSNANTLPALGPR